MPQENFAEVLLRTGKLAEAKTEGKTLFPATEGKHEKTLNDGDKRGEIADFVVINFLTDQKCLAIITFHFHVISTLV